jgi:GTPase SAR1 family protein
MHSLTSGNSLFTDVRNEFYKDAHGILLVFDVAKRSSFEALTKWLTEIYISTHGSTTDTTSTVDQLIKPVVLVCANKTDLRLKTTSSTDIGQVVVIPSFFFTQFFVVT